jgi:hypothetical protein
VWKMSLQWSLAENDATFRGGSSAGDDPLAGTPADKSGKDNGTRDGSAPLARGSASPGLR